MAKYRVFVQPDTMLPDPYNPQALNRYAYTLEDESNNSK
jgi:hypothetical protein